MKLTSRPRRDPKARRMKLPKYVYLAPYNKKRLMVRVYHQGQIYWGGFHDTVQAATRKVRSVLREIGSAA